MRIEEEWSIHASSGYPMSPARSQNLGVFLAGDSNSFHDQEAYLAMQACDFMCDLRNFVEPKRRCGDSTTFTGFGNGEHEEEKGRIDFIWLGPKQQVSSHESVQEAGANLEVFEHLRRRVDGYAVLPNVYEDGIYSSDRCVTGDVHLYSG